MKIACFLVVIAVLSACSSVALTGRKQLNFVNEQEVLTSSFQQYDEFMKTAAASSDAGSTQLVAEVGKKISEAVVKYFNENGMADQLEGYSWAFNLVKSDEVNAFCMPGGKIVVYEGILPYTQDATGLAVVMGHEVAHAVARHSNERMSQQMAASVGGELVNMALNKKSDLVRSLGGQVYGLGAQVGVMLPFSRKHELEADRLGLIFMAIAGYDPSSAVGFWSRMAQSGGGGTPEIMSTHPSDENRIENIKKYLTEALKYYTK